MGLRTEVTGPSAKARGGLSLRMKLKGLKPFISDGYRSRNSVMRQAEPRPECPCCHQALPAEPDLVVDLNTNTIVANGLGLQISPRTTEFIFVLRESYPRVVELSALGMKIWPHELEPQRWIRGQGTLARIALGKLGWTVTSIRNVGYRLEQLKINPAALSPDETGEPQCNPTSSAAARSMADSSVPRTALRHPVVMRRPRS